MVGKGNGGRGGISFYFLHFSAFYLVAGDKRRVRLGSNGRNPLYCRFVLSLVSSLIPFCRVPVVLLSLSLSLSLSLFLFFSFFFLIFFVVLSFCCHFGLSSCSVFCRLLSSFRFINRLDHWRGEYTGKAELKSSTPSSRRTFIIIVVLAGRR